MNRAALALAGLAAVGWGLVVWESSAMPGMGGGLVPGGIAMPADLPPALFLAAWLTMIAAMMVPAVVPAIAAGREPVGLLPAGSFTAGYLAVWTAAGVVPLLLSAVLRSAPQDALMGRGSSILAGALFAGAGLYQFTGWKAACLGACRRPLPAGGVRAGMDHGLRCLGCCWAPMALLLVVGVMNLAWMAGLTVVLVAERVLGRQAARAAGAVLVVVGVLVAAPRIWA